MTARGLGASYLGDGRCCFRVWAPGARRVSVHLLGQEQRLVPLKQDERGYHESLGEGVWPGCLVL